MAPQMIDRLVRNHHGTPVRAGTVMAVARFSRVPAALACAAAMHRAAGEARVPREAGLKIGIAADDAAAHGIATHAAVGRTLIASSLVRRLGRLRRWRMRPVADADAFQVPVTARLGKTVRTEAAPWRRAIGWLAAGLLFAVALIGALIQAE